MINFDIIEIHDHILHLSLIITNDVCKFCTITDIDNNITIILHKSSKEHDTLLQNHIGHIEDWRN